MRPLGSPSRHPPPPSREREGTRADHGPHPSPSPLASELCPTCREDPRAATGRPALGPSTTAPPTSPRRNGAGRAPPPAARPPAVRSPPAASPHLPSFGGRSPPPAPPCWAPLGTAAAAGAAAAAPLGPRPHCRHGASLATVRSPSPPLGLTRE